MKRINKYLAAVPLAIMVLGLTNCTKHDQVLDLTPPAEDIVPVLNTSVLNSASGTATLQPIGGAAWDGTIGAEWNAPEKLTVTATVPDLGNGTFEGFIGNSVDVTMRSLHDATNVYFLVEFNTPQKNVKSSPFYFDPAQTDMTKRWAQESGVPTLNTDGSTYRPAFIQDQFTFLFNINNSTAAFTAQSCYAACHKATTFGGPVVEGGVMYTNGPNELLDCWRARVIQPLSQNQANDCFIDDGSNTYPSTSGTFNKNQVHSDWQVLNGPASSVPPSLRSPGVLVSSPNATAVYAADGGFNNKQSMKISLPGGGFVTPSKKANIPIWVIPAGAYSNGTINVSDTLAGGAALKVIGVDSLGVLTLSDNSTIDPRTAASGTAYQRVGSGDGAKCIPGSIAAAYTGGRGDVTSNAFYTGTGWRILFKRALSTGDTFDADFSALKDAPFGIGAMYSGADNQHAIVAGLTLHFQ